MPVRIANISRHFCHFPYDPPHYRVSFTHFSFLYFPSCPYACYNLSSSLPLIIFHSKFNTKSMSLRETGLKKMELRKYVDCQVLKDTSPQSWTIKQCLQNKSKLHKLVVFLVYHVLLKSNDHIAYTTWVLKQ